MNPYVEIAIAEILESFKELNTEEKITLVRQLNALFFQLNLDLLETLEFELWD